MAAAVSSDHYMQDFLAEHVAKVNSLHLKALRNLEFYPDPKKSTLLVELNQQKTNFDRAAELRLTGKNILDIQTEVCKEARSWLKDKVPALIARYSNYQISDSEIKSRQKISKSCIAACTRKYKDALQTIKELKESKKCKLTDLIAQIKTAHETHCHAFKLYANGFSYPEIKSLTGLSLQTRVEDQTLPEIITKYGGVDLTLPEKAARQSKCQDIKARAVDGFKRAEALQAESGKEHLAKLKLLWVKDLQSLQRIIDLYQRGLSVTNIAAITGLPARNWILEDQLPVKLARSGLNLHRKDYALPRYFTSDCSYVLGAYFASSRVFSEENSMTVRSKSEEQIREFKDRFEKAFKTTLHAWRFESGNYVLSVGRREYLKDFLKFSKITSDKDPLITYEVLKYSDNRKAFLTGYLAFAGGSFNPALHRVSITRVNQVKILKGLAVALHYEGINPIFSGNSERADLCITDVADLRKLLAEYPDFGKAEERSRLSAVLPAEHEMLLGTYAEYQKVESAMKTHFPKGLKLDFARLLALAGIDCSPEQITASVKMKLQRWRNGDKPFVAEKIAKIQGYELELYRQDIKGY